MRFDRTVRIHHEHIDGTREVAILILSTRSHGQVADTVTVEIAETGDGRAEVIEVAQTSCKVSFCVADFLMELDSAVVVEEQYIDSAASLSAVIVSLCSDGDVGDAIPVEVTQIGDRESKAIVIVEQASEASQRVADLLMRLDRAVSIHEQHIDGSASDSSVAVMGSSDCHVIDPVAVQVSQISDRRAELIIVIQHPGEAASRVADLVFGRDGADRCDFGRNDAFQAQDEDSAAAGAAVIIIQCPDDQLTDSVTVQIAQICQCITECIDVIECCLKITLRVADLLRRVDCPICIHEQDIDSTATVASIVIAIGTNRQVRDSITVQVPQTLH